MTQKELSKICKKCKINDPNECVKCEYIKRLDRAIRTAAENAEIDFHFGMEAMGDVTALKGD